MTDVCFVALARSLSLSPCSLPILQRKIGLLRLYLKKTFFLLRSFFSNKTFASLRSLVRYRSLLARCQFCSAKLDSASSSRADWDKADNIAGFQAGPHTVMQIDIITVQQDQTSSGFCRRLFPMGGFYFYQHFFDIFRLKAFLGCASRCPQRSKIFYRDHKFPSPRRLRVAAFGTPCSSHPLTL